MAGDHFFELRGQLSVDAEIDVDFVMRNLLRFYRGQRIVEQFRLFSLINRDENGKRHWR